VDDEERVSKPNRRSKQEQRAHAQVVYRPMGVPEWLRVKGRAQRDRERGIRDKRARGKGL
jgi:hypothetical protein